MMPALMLPALPFTILMPALSLLLVFRTKLCRERSGLGLGLGLGCCVSSAPTYVRSKAGIHRPVQTQVLWLIGRGWPRSLGQPETCSGAA